MAAGKLVVVSNRLPFTLRPADGGWRTARSSGGLATAMGPTVARTGGVWVGWPGDSSPEDAARASELGRWREEHGYVAVELPGEVAGRFYEGYANQTLWPLFHQFPTRLQFESTGWDAYVEANRRFCRAVLDHVTPGARVWIHDYHLLLLPEMLRQAAPAAAIGFFLHIPFPASEMFRILPRRAEVLRGLLGADLLGFQTFPDLQNFRSSLLRVLGQDSRMDRVAAHGRVTRLEALPIGIAAEEFTDVLREDADAGEALARYRERFRDRQILLAVDRLDYTKGLPHRLRAFRRLLERAPHLHGRVVLVQVAVPSRENIEDYAQLRRTVNGLVGEINGEFGTPDWTPVSYIHRGIPRAELVALYALADVAWVTPLRDGMNLVAKEYVACRAEAPGVLVLSEFAGAAAEMGEAFVVNPYDEERTAEAVEAALALPADERRARMDALRHRVQRNNVFAWSERFLTTLDQAGAERALRVEGTAELPRADALAAFRAAARRMLVLDYDGTLVSFTATPRQAAPPADLVALLGRLATMPGTAMALVSGRRRLDLERWFSRVPGLALAAEHGALLKRAGGEWQPLRPDADGSWKGVVLPVLEHYADRTPGSFIEEKEHGLVWHYRLSDPEFGDWVANELVHNLEQMLAETERRAIRGHKVVEVRPAWAHKGAVVAWLEAGAPPPDFRLGIGDDRTDEDLFEHLPEGAWTVRVGQGPSRARFRLPDAPAVRSFLDALASSLG
ncbi:MAG TPA: bifunctional alpha,alpha-trehalose-phosphate synthase (UDP-forming)/trehalose-phosphatase [Vicinamibacteria bacterium]